MGWLTIRRYKMDALLRRRMMMGGGVSPTPPTPPTPTPIYELAEPTNTNNYDTGVKLFETPTSFTILCEAKNNNYNSNSLWAPGIFGVPSGTKNYLLKIGAIDYGKDMRENTLDNTGNKYTALVMNSTASDRLCGDLEERYNGALTRRFAVTYDATTRKVQGWSTNTRDDKHWYIVPAYISDSGTIKFNIGNQTGTVSIFRVYDSILDGTTITSFLNGN